MHHHRSRRAGFALTLAGALLIPVLSAGAQVPADNTEVNKRDRAKGAQTADQQKEIEGSSRCRQRMNFYVTHCRDRDRRHIQGVQE